MTLNGLNKQNTVDACEYDHFGAELNWAQKLNDYYMRTLLGTLPKGSQNPNDNIVNDPIKLLILL